MYFTNLSVLIVEQKPKKRRAKRKISGLSESQRIARAITAKQLELEQDLNEASRPKSLMKGNLEQNTLKHIPSVNCV